jgi:hypothetical protein
MAEDDWVATFCVATGAANSRSLAAAPWLPAWQTFRSKDCILRPVPADAVGQSPLRRHPQREVEEDDNKRLKDGSLDLGGGALSAAAEVERGGGLAQVQQAPAILQATTSLLLPFSTTYSASLQVVSFTWYALSYIRFP